MVGEGRDCPKKVETLAKQLSACQIREGLWAGGREGWLGQIYLIIQKSFWFLSNQVDIWSFYIILI